LEIDEMRRLLKSRFSLVLAAFVILNAAFSLYAQAAAPADFTLTEAGEAKTFTLSSAKGKYVALHFLLKTECPLCQMHTASFAAIARDAADVVHIFIKPDTEEEIAKWSANLPEEAKAKSPAIYRDPDAQLAKAFNIPDGYAFHGESVHYPALILLDPSGKEVFRYIGKSNQDRFTVKQFTAKMFELRNAKAFKQFNVRKDGVALDGYDPVSYFSGEPTEGKKEIFVDLVGVTYYFADTNHRDAFSANPEKYLPAYGGWCATAMAEGKKVEIDPLNYKVTDGRLFLFFRNLFSNAITDWKKDEPANTLAADKQWIAIIGN